MAKVPYVYGTCKIYSKATMDADLLRREDGYAVIVRKGSPATKSTILKAKGKYKLGLYYIIVVDEYASRPAGILGWIKWENQLINHSN